MRLTMRTARYITPTAAITVKTNTTVIFAPTVCSSRIELPMPGLSNENAYRPVRATAVDENRYLFQSMLRFATLQIQVRWELLSDGIPVASGQADLTLNPLEMRELTFDFELTQRSSCHNVLLVRYLRGDEELGFEQFTLTAPTPLFTVPGVPAPGAQVSEKQVVGVF